MEDDDKVQFYPETPFVRRPETVKILLQKNPPVLEKLLPWLTQTPQNTTYRVNVLKTTVESFKKRLEDLLALKYRKPPRVFVLTSLPEVVCIDAIRAPKPKPNNARKEVIVDTGCAAALLRGAHVYAPGVLAMESGTRTGEKVQVFCDLASKCLKGTNTRYESPSKVFIGIGRVLKQRHELYGLNSDNNLPAGVAIEMDATISGVPPLGNLSSCEALLQNLPSIVAVHVLDPQPGERILDMCASPGNKTTHIAEKIGHIAEKIGDNRLTIIIALDKNEQKISRIREKMWQNALESIVPFPYDSTKAYAEDGNNLSNANNYAPPYAANVFDRILLDAPCTGLGNRPLLHCTLTASQFPSFPKLQKQLVCNAVPMLKPNGVLIYSTCTITEEENEGVVAWILEKFPEMQLVAAVPKHGGDGLLNTGLTVEQCKLVQRFGPTYYNYNEFIDSVGFFIAKFIKKA